MIKNNIVSAKIDDLLSPYLVQSGVYLQSVRYEDLEDLLERFDAWKDVHPSKETILLVLQQCQRISYMCSFDETKDNTDAVVDFIYNQLNSDSAIPCQLSSHLEDIHNSLLRIEEAIKKLEED